MEIWRDIKGYEGAYQVSNLGNVRSLDRYVGCRGGKKRKIKGCLLKPQYNKTTKYVAVGLDKNSNKKLKTIHRLVAETFLPNPNNLPEVNHKDENPQNNRLENLEWCDRIYNINYGTHNEKMGNAHTKKIIQYDLDGNEMKIWDSIKQASQTLGISRHNIYDCLREKRNKFYNSIWKYAG